MNRLFVRTLATVLGALLILVALLAVLTVLGLRRSIAEWDSIRSSQLKALAVEILRERPTAVTVPDNLPLVVYDTTRQVVFSDRGDGARIRAAQLNPVLVDGRLLGYYQAGQMRFGNDAANNRFLISLRRSLWVGLGLSLAIAAAFAMLFSRSLSAPAVRVAEALDRIARGDLSSETKQEGAHEIALIGASANRLRLKLVREQELRRQWVHDVAHDLRTPVAALSAQLEGMRDGVLEASPARLEKVLREVGRVQELVSDLEELMRLESPEMRVSVESLEPGSLVEEVRERFDHLITGKEIQFRSRVSAARIFADGTLLRRAVSNFLSNAVRHCPDRGEVTVAVQAREGEVVLSVTNTGDPIPAEDLKRVFDRLFRGQYARDSLGSGLGLTIARRIAELHGGEVRIANRRDGVIVELLLPQPKRLA